MSLLLNCDTTYTDWCPQVTDDVLPSVLGLLPPGPAWDGAQIEGTVQNTYWRALSNVLAYTYSRLCLYVDEFFCLTVNESRDQWIKEFGLDASCDPFGNNLCLKVAANGGATCTYFVQMAALSGYVITCDQIEENEPIAGCFEVGCTGLGPTPVYSKWGSNLGYGQIGTCQYGEVVQHPDPAHWNTTQTYLSTCLVPGSNLGQGPDTDESCCFICGWYEMPIPAAPDNVTDFCHPLPNVISFECPRREVPSDNSPCASERTVLRGMDDSGNYSEWGNSYIWEVTLDAAASQALQQQMNPPAPTNTGTTSQAGDFMVGRMVGLPDGTPGCGTPLCFGDGTDLSSNNIVLCFLNLLKPAHTVLNVKVTQPT